MNAIAIRQETAREHIRNAQQIAQGALDLARSSAGPLPIAEQIELYRAIIERLHQAIAAWESGNP